MSPEPSLGVQASPRQRTGGLDPCGLKVFVSYSRRDIDFAEQLVAALEALGYTVIIDRKGIHGAEKWEMRLDHMILESDTVVFVLTPASAASEVCRWEVEQAIVRGKRLVPVVATPLDEGSQPHDALRDLNYIHFYPEPTLPGAGWGAGLAKLHATLCIEIEWIREHTRVAELAARWQAAGVQAEDFLARGSELANLCRWRDARPANAPDLTLAQRTFLSASEQAQEQRLDEERKQIETMRLAQEEKAAALEHSGIAQAERAKALKAMVRRTIAGIAVAGLLTVTASIFAVLAYRNGKEAETALRQIQDERHLQDRLIRLARSRGIPPPPYDIDFLATRYEGETPDHVGTDFMGGVYYGILRIKAGAQMENFLAFLRRWAQPLHDRLDKAGGAVAASSQTPQFLETWRGLGSDPASSVEFATLQRDFVKQDGYDRLVARLKSPQAVPAGQAARPSLDIDKRSLALRAVIFSIAVQHGPSSRLVQDALAEMGDLSKRTDAEIIAQLYSFRDRIDVYFPQIQARSPNFSELLRERNRWEQRDALHILEHGPK